MKMYFTEKYAISINAIDRSISIYINILPSKMDETDAIFVQWAGYIVLATNPIIILNNKVMSNQMLDQFIYSPFDEEYKNRLNQIINRFTELKAFQ